MKFFPTLEDTITLMTSNNFKNRLLAEYWQTKIRYERLRYEQMNVEQNEEIIPGSELDARVEYWSEQINAMKDYIDVLEERLVFEGVEYLEAEI